MNENHKRHTPNRPIVLLKWSNARNSFALAKSRAGKQDEATGTPIPFEADGLSLDLVADYEENGRKLISYDTVSGPVEGILYAKSRPDLKLFR